MADKDYEWTLTIETGQKGGKGSGHHGHAGRPGQRGGSAPGKGGGVGLNRDTLNEALASVNRLGQTTQMEWGTSFDSSGEHLWTGPGAERNMAPIADDATVIVHNHLSGLSFSAGDFAALIASPTLREIYAVAPNGTIYIAKKPANHPIRWSFETGMETIQGMLDEAISKAQGKDATDRYSNAIGVVAKELDLGYSTDQLP